jgi:beta-N-acetylhexosaminidase
MRLLVGLAAVPVLLLACSHADKPAAMPSCGDVRSLVSGMSTRDKLAQLLMVIVKDAADARAVVATYHVLPRRGH